MNIKHIMKVTGSVALSAIMAMASVPVAVNAEEKDENPTEKTETVYSVLNTDGSVSDIVVSSWLHDEDGIKNLKEKLNLTDVKNVKTDETPEEKNGEYTWNSDSNDVYYQGKATEKLPVSVKITYELDGEEVSEKDLQGKSGHLTIRIHMTNENSETKTINGKNIIIHPCFVAGGMMTLNTDHVSNVECEQGKIVSDGTNQMLVFAAVPGLKETLDSADLSKVSEKLDVGDDVEISCDVNDYESTSLMMGMSDEMDLSDVLGDLGSVDELADGINQLVSADDQLVEGSKQLEEGTQTLITESEPLTSSSDSIRVLSNGALTLNDGALRLKAALGQYTGGVSQLNSGVDALYAIPEGAAKISAGITTSTAEQTSLSDGVAALQAGIQQMKDTVYGNLSSTDVKAMMDQISTVNQTLDTMSDMVKTDLGILDGLSKTLTDTTTQLGTLPATITFSGNSIKNSLASSIGALQQAYAVMPDGEEKNTVDASIQTLSKEAGNLTTAFGTIQAAFNQLTATDKNGMSGQLVNAKNQLEALQNDLAKAKKALGGLSTVLSTYSGQISALTGMQATMDAGFDTLIAGTQSIQDGVTKVNAGVTALEEQSKAGIDQVKAATSTLSSNNAALNDGMSSLQGGTQTIADQSSSFNEMADGLDSLKKAFETLHDGAKQLSDGQQKFKDEGLSQLKEKVDLTVDELNMLEDIMDEVSNMNKKYREYAGDNEDMDVVTRYVFRTSTEESKK